MQQSLIAPIFFYALYIFILMIWMFFRRKKAIQNREFSMSYFRSYADKSQLPEHLLVHERHVDNQFQLPIIFMIVCAVYTGLERVDSVGLILAWGFVALRLCHTWVHLGKNNVMHRAIVYALGWIVVLAMLLRLLL